MTNEVKEKVDHLKAILDGLSPEEVTMITRGERPKQIVREDFIVIRKTIQDNIKTHLKKGKLLQPAFEEWRKEEVEVNGVKVLKDVRDHYKPYVREKK